jgi:hypothetical protein
VSEIKQGTPLELSDAEQAAATLAALRLKIGDTTEGDLILSDDDLAVFIAAWPDNLELAAADAAEAIAAKFSRGFNFSTDGQSFNRRERVEHYADLAKRLRSRGGVFVWPTPEPEDEP